MKKETLYLIGGIAFVFAGLSKNGGLIISWKFQLLFGLLMMGYSTLLSYRKNELKDNKILYIIGWGILPLIFLISNTFSNGEQILDSDLKEATNYQNITSCKEGKKRAKRDIENGKLIYIFGGFGSRGDLAKNLESKYDIEVVRLEGVLGLPNSCYNDIMHEKIQSKYGEDIFNNAMK